MKRWGSFPAQADLQARHSARISFGRSSLRPGERRAERDKQASVGSLKAVVDDYLAAKRPVVRPNTYRMLDHYLTAPEHFGPLDSMPVDTITRRDVAARLTKIGLSTSAITAGAACS